MKHYLLATLFVAGAIYLGSCGKRNVEEAYPKHVAPKDTTQKVDTTHHVDTTCHSTNPCAPCNISYRDSIAPLMEADCNGCHSTAYASGSGGNIILDTYSDFSMYASRVLSSMKASTSDSKFMPKGGQDPNDTCKLAKIKAWIDQGKKNN